MKVTLESTGHGAWTVRRFDEDGEVIEEVREAIPLSQVCRRLGKTRRQVYRYIQKGLLLPAGKFLGEWLVDPRGIEILRDRGRRFTPPPDSIWVLYPEYDPSDLHPFRDATVIVPKIMEQGDWREIAWMLRTYSTQWLKNWMDQEGWRLSPRGARFWSWWLGVPLPKPRRIGRSQ